MKKNHFETMIGLFEKVIVNVFLTGNLYLYLYLYLDIFKKCSFSRCFKILLQPCQRQLLKVVTFLYLTLFKDINNI